MEIDIKDDWVKIVDQGRAIGLCVKVNCIPELIKHLQNFHDEYQKILASQPEKG